MFNIYKFDCSKDDEDKNEIREKLNDPNKGFTICFKNKLKEAIENRNNELSDNQKVDLKKLDEYEIKTFFWIQKQKTQKK